jgi:hypothetical protein
MIDLMQQRQVCSCADCRAQRCESPVRYDHRIPSRTRPSRAYPIRRARAIRRVGAITSPSCQQARHTGAPSLAVSGAVAALRLPGCVPLNIYPIESNPTVQSAMQFCESRPIIFYRVANVSQGSKYSQLPFIPMSKCLRAGTRRLSGARSWPGLQQILCGFTAQSRLPNR